MYRFLPSVPWSPLRRRVERVLLPLGLRLALSAGLLYLMKQAALLLH